MKIEVKSTDVNVREFTNDDGTKRESKEQAALFHRGDGCVFPINLKGNGVPYPPGLYPVALDSIQAGKYGKLEFYPRPDLSLGSSSAKPARAVAG